MEKEIIFYRNGTKNNTKFREFKDQINGLGILENIVWGFVVDNKVFAHKNYNSLFSAYQTLKNANNSASITPNGVILRGQLKDPWKYEEELKQLALDYGYILVQKKITAQK